MRHVRSLGLRTDLMLIGWDGAIDDVGGVLRARSPGNPHFIFGNFLLFPDAPAPGDAVSWTAQFERELGPEVSHVCLRWDRPDGARGAAGELVTAGFTLEEQVVMETRSPRLPAKHDRDVELRRIRDDADWDATVALQVATMTELYGAGAAAFATQQMARYRRFVADGRGAWFGAFSGGALVADLGVFVEDGVARFQAIETAAAARRRGICGALVHHASRAALDELGAHTLVIVGLPDHTAKVYASAGFIERERLVAAFRSRANSAENGSATMSSAT